jgi:hypothetical protein
MAPRLIRYEVSPNQLRIRGDNGRTLAISDLRLEEAQSVDLTPLRTNGAGLPGYKAGWFRTASGRKALVFVRSLLLLSPADPAAFLQSLQSAAASKDIL